MGKRSKHIEQYENTSMGRRDVFLYFPMMPRMPSAKRSVGSRSGNTRFVPHLGGAPFSAVGGAPTPERCVELLPEANTLRGIAELRSSAPGDEDGNVEITGRDFARGFCVIPRRG